MQRIVEVPQSGRFAFKHIARIALFSCPCVLLKLPAKRRHAVALAGSRRACVDAQAERSISTTVRRHFERSWPHLPLRKMMTLNLRKMVSDTKKPPVEPPWHKGPAGGL